MWNSFIYTIRHSSWCWNYLTRSIQWVYINIVLKICDSFKQKKNIDPMNSDVPLSKNFFIGCFFLREENLINFQQWHQIEWNFTSTKLFFHFYYLPIIVFFFKSPLFKIVASIQCKFHYINWFSKKKWVSRRIFQIQNLNFRSFQSVIHKSYTLRVLLWSII